MLPPATATTRHPSPARSQQEDGGRFEMTTIPPTMCALVLHAYNPGSHASQRLAERPIPQPSKGEVLVRMAALQCLYGVNNALPMVSGIEGCGAGPWCGPGRGSWCGAFWGHAWPARRARA